jgi:hypothetical protein
MTRTFRYALTAVLSAVVVLPAFAQDNFPDVPDNHWAYEALARMKAEGLLVGYPDGLFRGPRPATRYELAVAVHATYSHLKSLIDGLQSQLDAIKNAPTNNQADIDALKAAVAALQNDVAQIRSQDIADLRRMAETFEKELAALGVDVQQMKRDLGELADRVTNLENRLPVDISGDLNLALLTTYGDKEDDILGIDLTGRPLGTTGGVFPGTRGDHTFDVYHEGSVTLTGARKTGPRFSTTLVFGNTLGDTAFGTQSTIPDGSFYGQGDGDFWVQRLSVALDTSLLGTGLDIEAGRIGYKISPYIFQKPDVTPYYENDRWDNREWMFDGANIGLGFGNAKIRVFGGSTNSVDTVDNKPINPMQAGGSWSGATRPIGIVRDDAMTVNEFLGANLNVPLFDNGSLNLAYLWLKGDATLANPVNRVDVLGGDARFNFGNFVLAGGFSKSDSKLGDDDVVDDENTAWYGELGLNANRWSGKIGFRQIEPFFGAPGDWGRIGIWWNPTDIRGIYGELNFDLSSDIRLTAQGQAYSGVDDDAALGLSEDDDVTSFRLGVAYKMASDYDLSLGVEQVKWEFDGGGGEPTERWYNIGFGWNVSDNAKLRFLWQISDYDADGLPAFNVFGQDEARGGLFTSQLSVRF